MFLEQGPDVIAAVRNAIQIFNEKLSGMVDSLRMDVEQKGGFVGLFDDGKVFAVRRTFFLPLSPTRSS
jgi:hypothetical protein